MPSHPVRPVLILVMAMVGGAISGLFFSTVPFLQAQSTSPLTIQPDTGRVGIGTMTPVSKLQVGGDVALQSMAAGTARSLPTGTTLVWNDGQWLRLNQNLDYSKPIFGVHTPGVLAPVSLNVGGAGNWGDPGAGNTWITGNVGIGTTTPVAKLDVAGTVKLRSVSGAVPGLGGSLGWGNAGSCSNIGELQVRDDGTTATLCFCGRRGGGGLLYCW